jgi:hypothetical protein
MSLPCCTTAPACTTVWRPVAGRPVAGRPVAAPVLQLRVPQDTLARGDAARSAWVQRLIDRELSGQAATAADPLILPGGEPSPGVACAGPGCWNRDTARYGLRRLVLCTACVAALQGRIHQRQLPESAARAIRRGA